MKKLVSVVLGVALLGTAAACGDGSAREADPGPSAVTTPTASTTTTSAPPPPPKPAGPLTGAQYQASLAKVDQQIATDLRGLTGAKSGDNLADAMDTLAESLNSTAAELALLKVQPNVAAAHKTLQTRLRAAAASLTGPQADDVDTNAKCGGVVYTSQKVQRKLTADLTGAIAPLRRFGLKFGTTLPDLGPEPADQRPSNGDVLVRSGSRGSGRLQVTNGTTDDVAVAIVTDGKPPSKPHLLVYVQAKKTATINRIGGKYHVFFKSGTDWNPKRRQFSAGCSFQKFDDGFGRNEAWKIDLQPTLLGNASTSDVDAF
ncbi:hypothetical protein BWI15_35585 [Kribbella sp. ALI-6-A]|uniref:hypothetical protein n=1 Tax=Kribbella sp. ALI-6-A TaxID=1933817 RepID=UPI00097CA7F9|nr:hypothetical protein [Kribbella sp. ALI-6-A]ONI68331.1 hypothetical protein BWI15_35585 [Kribbella sp. ALI-6-A]